MPKSSRQLDFGTREHVTDERFHRCRLDLLHLFPTSVSFDERGGKDVRCRREIEELQSPRRAWREGSSNGVARVYPTTQPSVILHRKTKRGTDIVNRSIGSIDQSTDGRNHHERALNRIESSPPHPRTHFEQTVPLISLRWNGRDRGTHSNLLPRTCSSKPLQCSSKRSQKLASAYKSTPTPADARTTATLGNPATPLVDRPTSGRAVVPPGVRGA